MVIGLLRRTIVGEWRFDNLYGSRFQSQVIVLVSWRFKNPGELFDWSMDRVAVGKRVMWLALKTCAKVMLIDGLQDEQGVTVSCWVIVCKVREEVDNDLGQFVLS